MPAITDIEGIIQRACDAFGVKGDSALAARIGVSQGAIGNWRFRRKIGFEALAPACIAENISVNWVVTGNGSALVPPGDPEMLAYKRGFIERLQEWVEMYRGLHPLAVFLGVEDSEVFAWLDERRNELPDAAMLERFHNSGCNIYWLVTGTGWRFNATEQARLLGKLHGLEPVQEQETGVPLLPATPPELTRDIQHLYQEFQEVMEKHGLE